MDNVSYALGLGIGSQLKSMGAESLNIDDFAQAIKDVLNDSELKISMADSQKIVQKFFHGHTAPESTATRQLARMIEEVGMTFIISYAAVVGERFCVAQRHNLTGIGPRPSRCRCRAVADVLRHPAGSIKELVLFFVLNFIL